MKQEAEDTEEETEAGEASLEEILAKRSQDDAEEAEGEGDSMLTLTRDDPNERLPGKVAPKRATEFVCKKCFLVKHQSQLADKRRGYCRDCVKP